MAEITKNMKISDILALNELMAPFLMQNGLSCVTCAASQAESLEQLRVLWNGYAVAVALLDAAPPAGVDTHEDLARVRQLWQG